MLNTIINRIGFVDTTSVTYPDMVD